MAKDTHQKWFKDAKYGLFIHWGLYSLLAGEYKGKKTPNIGEWIMNHLDIPVEEYEKLAAQFNPVNFDAEKYVSLAKKWGMRYIVFTAKHHDGFAMYGSKCKAYNIVDATPFGRDVLKELQTECERNGIKLGVYYSQAQDWHDSDGYAAYKDNSKKNFRNYLDRTCIPQIKELLSGYGEIALMWFDTPVNMTREESEELKGIVKSIQPDCIVSGRIGNNLGEYMTTGDNFIPLLPYKGDWEVPATLNETWGYKKDDNRWKASDDVIRHLLKINQRGGNYLINIGPDAMGDIPKGSVEVLDAVGSFIRKNSESIYGTKCVDLYPYDIEWALFTAKDYKLYIHIIRQAPRYVLMNMGNTVKRMTLLHSGEEIGFDVRKSCEGDGIWEFFLPDSVEGHKNITICVEMNERDLLFEPLRHME